MDHCNYTSQIDDIIKVNDNYLQWWYSDLVQKSISSFLNEYGLSSDFWLNDWFDEIQSGMKEIND